ncbi:uncharacterized protein LOC122944502 [Bufo gargarizans]|uniref:uncharacterized protein LOC122944502 n=1 Tax=Bufo gargarizans TaxID=30331 RepID=UPI001CF59BD6|nr:uncharacterized protein LOC122944502 [Bufo gargarizans]
MAASNQEPFGLDTIESSITQLHVVINTMASSMAGFQARLETVEASSAVSGLASQRPAASTSKQSNVFGGSGSTPSIAPSHFIPANIRQDIIKGKDVNLASLLIAAHEAPDNKTITCGEVSVDVRLDRKLSIAEFVLAFSLYRAVICTVSPHRREELDLYLYKVVELGQKYGGTAFYDYHRSFSAKAAAALAQFQHTIDWSNLNTELFC